MATVQLQSLILTRSSRVPSLTFSGSDLPLERLFRLAPPREPLLAEDASLATKNGILKILVSEAKKTLEQFVGDVTDLDWERLVLSAGSTVVVGFWARWSGPSLPILPIFDEVAQEYSGRLNCYKLEVDENPSTATRYPARTLPTFIIFKNGERKDTVIGAVPKTTLTSTIEKYL